MQFLQQLDQQLIYFHVPNVSLIEAPKVRKESKGYFVQCEEEKGNISAKLNCEYPKKKHMEERFGQ